MTCGNERSVVGSDIVRRAIISKRLIYNNWETETVRYVLKLQYSFIFSFLRPRYLFRRWRPGMAETLEEWISDSNQVLNLQMGQCFACCILIGHAMDI